MLYSFLQAEAYMPRGMEAYGCVQGGRRNQEKLTVIVMKEAI
jgi:hypothetical protein